MKYYEVQFRITPNSEMVADILSALLAEVGFEAFEPSSQGVSAWIQQSLYAEESVISVVNSFPIPDVSIDYSVSEAPDENWNQVWEQEGFRPIVISEHSDGQSSTPRALIAIHDTTHTEIPEARYDIKINPCQAFGTGSHETTRMILRQLIDMPMQGRHVVDAGTGTGILAIMCRMLNAAKVLAYDIDEWSVRNARENLLLNNIIDGVHVLLGDSTVIGSLHDECTDGNAIARDFNPTLVIANINRNILLSDMPRFATWLPSGGELLLSGFYVADVPVLLAESARCGFSLVQQKEDDDWALLLLKKG